MADVLIIDDQDRTFDMCRRAISEHRYQGPARNAQDALNVLRRGRTDVVLLDIHFDIETDRLVGFREGLSEDELGRLKRFQGIEILRALRRKYPDLPVVVMTSRDELGLGDLVRDLDVEDYTYFLDDDFVDARMLQAQIANVLAARDEVTAEGQIFWGASRVMRDVRHRLKILAKGRLPVMLLGPTGTGKSLIARDYIHGRSGRKGAFVAVDLATIPTDLMSAHLFGAVKGAYTGSVGDRKGAFEAADGGTLFLDEVGNLGSDAQKILLSVLQDGRITRLGDVQERPVDVKLVVATNEDLGSMVQEGRFRADLYMRLNPSTAVHLPRLTDRSLDFNELVKFAVDHALSRPQLRELLDEYRLKNRLSARIVATHLGTEVPERDSGRIVILFSERCMRLLRQYSWPGNLREFFIVIENALLFALTEISMASAGRRSDVIQIRPKLLSDMLLGASPRSAGSTVAGDEYGVRIISSDSLNKVAQECERQYFETMYIKYSGDFAKMACELLGETEHARKVQLRFNQLGLKVRELRGKLS